MKEESFEIISLSNASLDVYPENTLSKFTHRLPTRIGVSSLFIPMVALNTIVIHNKIKSGGRIPTAIKVHLKELNVNNSPFTSDAQVLATLPFKSGENLHWERPEVPIFRPLNVTGEITELSFLITDEYNEQLQLDYGSPSLIQLTMTMTRSVESFSIILNQETSKDLYPDNTICTWSCELPESFQVDTSMEVCLHSIQVSKSLYIDETSGFVMLHRWRKDLHQNKFGLFARNEKLILNLYEKEYTDETLVTTIKRWLYPRGFILIENDKGMIKISRREHMSEEEKNMFGMKDTSTNTRFEAIEISPTIVKILGLRGAHSQGFWKILPRTFRSSPLRLRFQWTERKSRDIRLAQVTPDHLAIYCDLVTPSIIGNVFGNIMDVIPTDDLGLTQFERDKFYTVARPIFRDVNMTTRRTVKVAIRALDGSIPNIIHDRKIPSAQQHPMSLTVVFRKKNIRF